VESNQTFSAVVYFYGGFSANKIWQRVRRAIFFTADFRRIIFGGEFLAAEGSMHAYLFLTLVNSVKTAEHQTFSATQ